MPIGSQKARRDRTPDGARLFTGDGGLETSSTFGQGFELPCFAVFVLLRDERGIGPVVEAGRPWLRRLAGIRANASRKSHAELDRTTYRVLDGPGLELRHFGEAVTVDEEPLRLETAPPPISEAPSQPPGRAPARRRPVES